MVIVQDILSALNAVAPFQYQESYDNSGLLVGDATQAVTGITVALDCTEDVINDAISTGANVVVTHHPILFKGLKRLTGSDYVERTIILAIKHNIALIAIHTNLDNYRFGVNHVIANRLNLKGQRILAPKEATLSYLGVYVPQKELEFVKSAMQNAGAGTIGDYSNCSFQFEGTGQFQPSEMANPFIGKANLLEKVSEVKLEMVCPQHALNAVLNAMRTAHPYEEVAYHVLAMSNSSGFVGSGMIGQLDQPMEKMAFLKFVKEQFNCEVVRYTESAKETVQTIAVCGGAGGFLLKDALRNGADVFITADYKYHEFFDADRQIIIADIGHFESEQFTSDWLVSFLTKKFTTFAVRLTNVSTNPIKYL